MNKMQSKNVKKQESLGRTAARKKTREKKAQVQSMPKRMSSVLINDGDKRFFQRMQLTISIIPEDAADNFGISPQDWDYELSSATSGNS